MPHDLTPEERAEEKAAIARENGKKGGRPKSEAVLARERDRQYLEDLKVRYRRRGALAASLAYWLELAEGRHATATHSDRIRATENLANRLGLVNLTESQVPRPIKVKLFQMMGWKDDQGVFHPGEMQAAEVTVEEDDAEQPDPHTEGGGGDGPDPDD